MVALIAVATMVMTGVLSWDDVLGEKAAWDALIWFGGLVMMAGQLDQLGFMKWFAGTVGSSISEWACFPP